MAFTYFLLDRFMVRATPYWTQKGLIANYYKMRRSPDEHLLVWQMYWRGENFYTQNEIYEGPKEERTIFLGDKNFENLKSWMERHRGRRAFFLVEHSRYSTLETAVPADARKTLKIVDGSNMKFCLASADLLSDTASPRVAQSLSLSCATHQRRARAEICVRGDVIEQPRRQSPTVGGQSPPATDLCIRGNVTS